MRFLVTGATGFVGSHVADLLADMGYEVVCPVRNPQKLGRLKTTRVKIAQLSDLVHIVNGDHPFDYVLHLAGATRALTYGEYERANVRLTTTLLNHLAKPRRQPKRFVLVSSQAAAGPSPNDVLLTENGAPHPVSEYGRSKLAAENAAHTFSDRIDLTIVRPSVVFGPRDADVFQVFKWTLAGLNPYLRGGDRLVSVIYVKDLAEGILAAALGPQPAGETYFLANQAPVVWKAFIQQVCRALNRKGLFVPVPIGLMKAVCRLGDAVGGLTGRPALLRSEKFAEMAQMSWACSPRKAEEDFGWRATRSLDEALTETARWYKENRWL